MLKEVEQTDKQTKDLVEKKGLENTSSYIHFRTGLGPHADTSMTEAPPCFRDAKNRKDGTISPSF